MLPSIPFAAPRPSAVLRAHVAGTLRGLSMGAAAALLADEKGAPRPPSNAEADTAGASERKGAPAATPIDELVGRGATTRR